MFLFKYYAKLYDPFMKIFRLDRYEHIHDKIGSDCHIIYDVGGGTGLLADELVKRGKQVWLIDPCDPMTKIARQRNPDIRIVPEYFHGQLDLPKADVIIFNDSLHHIGDHEAVLRYCRGYLNEGGQLLIRDFHPDSLFVKILFLFERICFERIVPINLRDLKCLGEKSGFCPEDVSLNAREFLYIGSLRKITR